MSPIDQNGVATAQQPGSNRNLRDRCADDQHRRIFLYLPAEEHSLSVGTTGQTSVTVNPNNVQPLTTTVLDTNDNPITGLSLIYSSNDPVNIPVSNSGSVAPVFPATRPS